MANLGVRVVKLRCPVCSTGYDVVLPRGSTWKASIDIPNWGTIPADTAPGSPAVPDAAWYADPLARHQYRYWDGNSWTQHVADDGSTSTDPLDTPARGDSQSSPANAGMVTGDSAASPDDEEAPVSIVAFNEPQQTSSPDPQRVAELRAALRDANWQECERAARSLKEIGWEPDTDEDRAWSLAAAGRPTPAKQWVAVADAAIEPLTFALEGRYYGSPWPDPGTQDDWCAGDRRTWAAETLGQIRDVRALPALIGALDQNDQNGQTAAAAAEALGKLRDERAVDPLVSRLNNLHDGGYWAPATAAATALGKIGSETAIAALIAYVDTAFQRPEARVAAAKALVALESAGKLDAAQAHALSDLRVRDDWPL